ncbi:MAG: BON domain-containing protein [Hyphomicrobiales bacterium]
MKTFRRSTLLIGLVPLGLLVALVLTVVREKGESDMAQRVAAALNNAGHQWATVSVKGRDVKVSGVAFDEVERDNAMAVAQGIPGVRTVNSRVDLQSARTPYSWRVTYRSNRLRIKGYVPSSDDRRTILGFLKASLPDAEIDDRMELASGGPAREVWLGAVSFALAQLGRMKSGSVRIDGTQLAIAGEAKTPSDYEMMRKALAAELPVGIQLAEQQVTPPRVKPFTWAGQFDGNAVVLTGYVSSDEMRQSVVKAARQSFGDREISDRMEIAIGAPGAWADVIGVLLNELARSQSGRIEMSEVDVTFAAVIKEKSLAQSIQSALQNRLPSDYKVKASFDTSSGTQTEGRSSASQGRSLLKTFAGALAGGTGLR